VVSGLGAGVAIADWDWLMWMLVFRCRNGTLHHKLKPQKRTKGTV
jgi:hypothetical protein